MGTTLDRGPSCDGRALGRGTLGRRCDHEATYSLTVPHVRSPWTVCLAHLDRMMNALHARYGLEPTVRRILAPQGGSDGRSA